jgi:hypothetical protein
MLQQAFVIALFPEHHVRVLEKIPEAEPAETDLVIVDAAALCERGSLPALDIGAVQSWRIPVVWIGAEVVSGLAASKNLARLSAPVKRDALRSAVTEGLRAPPADHGSAQRAEKRFDSVVAAKKKTSEPKLDSVTGGQDQKIIELVDVIEEVPGAGRPRR